MTRPSFTETGLGGLFSPDPWGSLAYVPTVFLPQRFAAVLEALEKGQPVDLSAMPPSPEGQYQGRGGGGKPAQARAGAGQASLPTHTYTCALDSPDLKPLPQASQVPTAPSDTPPAVERMHPVMASDIPAAPGRPGDTGVGTWGEAGRANTVLSPFKWPLLSHRQCWMPCSRG